MTWWNPTVLHSSIKKVQISVLNQSRFNTMNGKTVLYSLFKNTFMCAQSSDKYVPPITEDYINAYK